MLGRKLTGPTAQRGGQGMLTSGLARLAKRPCRPGRGTAHGERGRLAAGLAAAAAGETGSGTLTGAVDAPARTAGSKPGRWDAFVCACRGREGRRHGARDEAGVEGLVGSDSDGDDLSRPRRELQGHGGGFQFDGFCP